MLFKKSKKDKTPAYTGEPGMVYSMEPRQGHGQDVVDEDGIRQVAGCLPIDPINKRFLLVTSSSNPGSWVIPKGGWEKDETQKQAAMRETWEEAGVKGSITRHIGVFAEKTKNGVKAHHWIYEMEIKEITKKFPEQKKRDRRWFSYDEAMLVVKAHYIHDALSMSSLSPLVHPYCESLQSGDKKEKKKDKKKKKKKLEEEDEDSEDSEEKKAKKEKKKKEKKEKKASDEEEDQISLVDENGVPLTEEQIEERKKQKKKEKKQKKKEAKKGEIVELTEEEIKSKTMYSSTPLGQMDVTPPPLKPNNSSVNEAALNQQMRQTYITAPVPNVNYNRPPPQQYNPQQQQQRPSPPPPQQQQQQQQQRYPSPPQQQHFVQQQPQFRPMPQQQQYIRPGPPHPQQQQPPYPHQQPQQYRPMPQQQQFRPMSPPLQQPYQVRPHPQQFPPAQQYQPHIADKHQLS